MESLLDEATAELGKTDFSPMLATIEIEFKISKAVPLHTTLRIDCEARAWPHIAHAAADAPFVIWRAALFSCCCPDLHACLLRVAVLKLETSAHGPHC